MKKSLLFLILLLCFGGLSAQTRVVKAPPFSLRNSTTIEIDSISLNSESTVFHIISYFTPHSWIRIASDTYIVAGGQKYIVKSANGIELNKEEFMDDTGMRRFTLTFPAIPKESKQIDFIESDCQDCFKIWGIELDSPVLTNKEEVPATIKTLVNAKDDKLPLPIPKFVDGKATLKGHLLGYRPVLASKGEIVVYNPMTEERIELEMPIGKDGKFAIDVAVVCTMEIWLRIPSIFSGSILVTPNKETSVYIDLQEKYRQEARTRVDKSSNDRFVYFGGANAELNNQVFDLEEYFSQNLNVYNQAHLNGKTPDEFKQYVFDIKEKMIAELASKKLTCKALEFASLKLDNEVTAILMNAGWLLESAHRKANNLDYRAKLTNYNQPIFEKEYYAFLKTSKINNPLSLYLRSYGDCMDRCKRINIGPTIFITKSSVSLNQLNNFSKAKSLKGEELSYITTLKDAHMDSWSRTEVDTYKKHISSEFKKLIDTQKLEGSYLNEANWILNLCNKQDATPQEIDKHSFNFAYRIKKDSIFKLEEINKIGENPVFETKLKPNEKLSEGFFAAFFNKYREDWEALMNQSSFEKNRKELASILGVDKGIAFDLMEVRSYTQRFEDMSPLSVEQLASLKKMSNPFYYTYLNKRNNNLKAELKLRELNKLDNIIEAPKVDNDKLFEALVKPYEGKVVFIDFWATWCGPCRSAMKDFAATKKTFDGKDVEFIYLTDHSSPINLWEKMIADISGKHYRLEDEQFKYLKNKFGVRGIPSYLILNKKGEQVYFNVGFEGSSKISQILNEELAK